MRNLTPHTLHKHQAPPKLPLRVHVSCVNVICTWGAKEGTPSLLSWRLMRECHANRALAAPSGCRVGCATSPYKHHIHVPDEEGDVHSLQSSWKMWVVRGYLRSLHSTSVLLACIALKCPRTVGERFGAIRNWRIFACWHACGSEICICDKYKPYLHKVG